MRKRGGHRSAGSIALCIVGLWLVNLFPNHSPVYVHIPQPQPCTGARPEAGDEEEAATLPPSAGGRRPVRPGQRPGPGTSADCRTGTGSLLPVLRERHEHGSPQRGERCSSPNVGPQTPPPPVVEASGCDCVLDAACGIPVTGLQEPGH